MPGSQRGSDDELGDFVFLNDSSVLTFEEVRCIFGAEAPDVDVAAVHADVAEFMRRINDRVEKKRRAAEKQASGVVSAVLGAASAAASGAFVGIVVGSAPAASAPVAIPRHPSDGKLERGWVEVFAESAPAQLEGRGVGRTP